MVSATRDNLSERLYEKTGGHSCKRLFKFYKDAKKRKLAQGNLGGGLSRVSKTISMEPKFCSWTFHRNKLAHQHARRNVNLGGAGGKLKSMNT